MQKLRSASPSLAPHRRSLDDAKGVEEEIQLPAGTSIYGSAEAQAEEIADGSGLVLGLGSGHFGSYFPCDAASLT